MGDPGWLVDRFQERRSHLRAVAYRMLGSVNEADDAMQEAWLRLTRGGASRTARADRGAVGLVWGPVDHPHMVFDLTIENGRISRIELIADPERLRVLEVNGLR
jgi:Sigma-70 region 2